MGRKTESDASRPNLLRAGLSVAFLVLCAVAVVDFSVKAIIAGWTEFSLIEAIWWTLTVAGLSALMMLFGVVAAGFIAFAGDGDR